MMRAFLALPIPEACADALIRVQAAIPFGRPVPEDNLHLTLAFLGDVEGNVLEDLHGMLLSLRAAPVEISFVGLDSFTEMERGLVFADVRRTEALRSLQERVAGLCRAAGCDLPRRRFRPHVTLMRANRRPRGVTRDRLAASLGPVADLPGFTAHVMTLYRSDLSSKGALHVPLADYPLVG